MLAVLLSSCRLDAALDLTVLGDGSGTVVLTLVTDRDFEANASLTGRPFRAYVEERMAGVPDAGLEVAGGADGTTTYRITASGDDPQELMAILGGLGVGLDDVQISADRGRVTVAGASRPLTGVAELATYLEGFDPTRFDEHISAVLRLRLPGTLTYTNADRRGGETLEWSVLLSDPGVTFGASSEAPDGFPWGLAVLVVALGAAFGFLALVRRTTSTKEVAGDGDLSVPVGRPVDS